MIFVDAHVHVYDCFDLDLLFDSAMTNFQAAVKQSGIENQPLYYMLLLAEGTSCNWFQNIITKIKTKQNLDTFARNWKATLTEEALSLAVCRNSSSDEKIYLIAGRQIVTAEKIEVLALFCNTAINDGQPLNETIDIIRQNNGIAVIPWGVGKWFGKRGKVLQNFLAGSGKKEAFLGDNGGRPLFWPTPTLFHLAGRQGVSVLSGTDPLPLAHEAERVGSYGFFLDGPALDMRSPAISVRDLLITGQETLHPFGHLQNINKFFSNQLQLRFNS